MKTTPGRTGKLAVIMLVTYFGLSAMGSGLLVLRGVLRAPIVEMPVRTLIWNDAVVAVLSVAAALALWWRSATGWWLAVVLVATTIARRAPEFLTPWEGEYRPGIVVSLRALILLATLLALALLIGRRRDFWPQQKDEP